MSYEQIKALRPADFKRYCGVEPETFRRMVELVSKRLTKERRKAGRPPKLSVDDQVLQTLEYWREYRTLFHLATSWGLLSLTSYFIAEAAPVKPGAHLTRDSSSRRQPYRDFT